MKIPRTCKNFLSLILSFSLIVALTFFLMKMAPGNPFSDENGMPQETYNALVKHYGLDLPVSRQFLQYVFKLLQGDLGPSLTYKGRTAAQIIRESFPVSAFLGAEAFFIALFAGIFLGTVSAFSNKRWLDHLTLMFAALGVSIPSFILASLLQFTFSIKLGVFPVARWGTLAHTVLPAICLAALPAAFIARLVRANMKEILKQDYIKCAQAKGLTPMAILFKHVMKNSLAPMLGYFGQLSANILTGSFVIEKIFAIPGLGQWFVNSVYNRDYPVIMGTTIFYSALLLTALFLADVAAGLLDPRIRKP